MFPRQLSFSSPNLIGIYKYQDTMLSLKCTTIAVHWQTYPTTRSNVRQHRQNEPQPTLCSVMYDEESVNSSRMDIKSKTCDIRTKRITFISRHILHQHWYVYTCPIALPVRRNPQHTSLLAVVSTTSAPPFHPLRHQRCVCNPVNRFTRQTLPTVNTKYFFMNTLYIEHFCPQKWTQQNASLR
jgi:hypothetical protein